MATDTKKILIEQQRNIYSKCWNSIVGNFHFFLFHWKYWGAN